MMFHRQTVSSFPVSQFLSFVADNSANGGGGRPRRISDHLLLKKPTCPHCGYNNSIMREMHIDL